MKGRVEKQSIKMSGFRRYRTNAMDGGVPDRRYRGPARNLWQEFSERTVSGERTFLVDAIGAPKVARNSSETGFMQRPSEAAR